jgi:hypothetical protein
MSTAIPLKEFDGEMASTRRLLERVPTEKGEWKPHAKSFSVGHLARLVAWMPAREVVVRRAFLVAALAVAPVVAARAQTTATFLGYTTTVPATWTARTPSSTSRLAEYTRAGAEVVVYFFGPQMGGNVDANLTRWRGQFSTADGSKVPETVTRDSSGAFPLTFAEFRGTYKRGIGMGSADSVRTGQTLIAAIAETPKGTLFIQLFGRSTAVEAERNTFKKFVRGLKP